MRIEPKEIIRTRRKTIALVIDNDGELIVRAPYYASNRDVNFFIQEKQAWVQEKSLEMKRRKAENPKWDVRIGNTVQYMGQEYTLDYNYSNRVFKIDNTLYVPDRSDRVEALVKWYKAQASEVLRERVEKYAKIMNVEPTGIKITSAKTRWGSCSYRNSLNFSWRVMMCPLEVIDYVVVHELSHIRHKDHSKDFWKHVEQYDKLYDEHEKWLKNNQRLMDVV